MPYSRTNQYCKKKIRSYPTNVFSQQRKLMGSSALNSSSVHWCRRRVRFNRVPEKVPERVWEALVQSQVRFNRICGHLIHPNPADVFPALGVAARFRKICKNKTLQLLGIPPKFIFKGYFCSDDIILAVHDEKYKNLNGIIYSNILYTNFFN